MKSKSVKSKSIKPKSVKSKSVKPKSVKPKRSKTLSSAQSLDFQGLSETEVKNIFSLMLKARVLEERLIKIYKAGGAFFWIGAPGEEAFGVPLGLLVHKGQGVSYDFLHLHYRATPTLVAMGMSMKDAIRLIMNKATDPHTGGRNFSNHYCIPQWNVTPVTSPIEVQYSFSIGTALAQSRNKNSGITIVTGGDAGTAESDFSSCLIWSSRPQRPLPILITVQNNLWGISTSYEGQHGEEQIADRGMPYGIKTRVINGNDPIETYFALKEEMDYIRKERKPVVLEARVSRLYGHSSASGANFMDHEVDCVKDFGRRLSQAGVVTESEIQVLRSQFEAESKTFMEEVRKEPYPDPQSLWDHTFANNENADWRYF